MEQPEQDYEGLILILQARLLRIIRSISVKNDPIINSELLKDGQKNLDFMANICQFYIPNELHSDLYNHAVKNEPGDEIKTSDERIVSKRQLSLFLE